MKNPFWKADKYQTEDQRKTIKQNKTRTKSLVCENIIENYKICEEDRIIIWRSEKAESASSKAKHKIEHETNENCHENP